MNERRIRTPKLPVFNYLFNCFSYISSILSVSLLSQFMDKIQEPSPMAIFNYGLLLVTNLFFAIVLLKRRYDTTLIIASALPLVRCIVGCIINFNATWIIDAINWILLSVFAYIMVKMPDTSAREKAVKLRFIFPVYELVAIVISTIQMIRDLFDRLDATGNDAMTNAILAIPTICSAIAGFLPFISSILLINWMADPYEKQKQQIQQIH